MNNLSTNIYILIHLIYIMIKKIKTLMLKIGFY